MQPAHLQGRVASLHAAARTTPIAFEAAEFPSLHSVQSRPQPDLSGLSQRDGPLDEQNSFER